MIREGNRIEMVEHRELGKVDARIARAFDDIEAWEKAERKENLKSLVAPAFLAGTPILATAVVWFGVYLPYFGLSSAKDTAGVIEEWSAANPTKSIPYTDDFISYPDYLSKLGLTTEEAPYEELDYINKFDVKPEEVMVKVVDNNSHSGFTVCSYVGSEDSTFYTFDSITGEPVKNEVKECS